VPYTRNIRLLVEYEGTRYCGWQSQADQPTVQETLQRAIQRMIQEQAVLTVAGRTDTGVHAIAQVANFRSRSRISIDRFAPGLNKYLPNDISIHQASDVPLAFDAKRDSKSKRYRYRVYRSPQPAALSQHSWQIRAPMDVEGMRQAAAYLVGKHDFNAFRSVHCDAAHAIRQMHRIDIDVTPRPPMGEHIDILFHGNSYCRHMCRIIAGTLVEIGMGRRPATQMQEILDGRDRTMAGVTAPAAGLTLLEVMY